MMDRARHVMTLWVVAAAVTYIIYKRSTTYHTSKVPVGVTAGETAPDQPVTGVVAVCCITLPFITTKHVLS